MANQPNNQPALEGQIAVGEPQQTPVQLPDMVNVQGDYLVTEATQPELDYKDAYEKLQKEHGELRKFSGQQGNEVGVLRQLSQQLGVELDTYKGYAQQPQQQYPQNQFMPQLQQEVPIPDIGLTDADFLASPRQAIAKLADAIATARLHQTLTALGQAAYQQQVAQADSGFKQQHPDIAHLSEYVKHKALGLNPQMPLTTRYELAVNDTRREFSLYPQQGVQQTQQPQQQPVQFYQQPATQSNMVYPQQGVAYSATGQPMPNMPVAPGIRHLYAPMQQQPPQMPTQSAPLPSPNQPLGTLSTQELNAQYLAMRRGKTANRTGGYAIG